MKEDLKQKINELARQGKLETTLIRIELENGLALYGRTRGINDDGRLIFLEPTGPHTNDVEETLREIRAFEIVDAQWAAYHLNALSMQVDSANKMMRVHRR